MVNATKCLKYKDKIGVHSKKEKDGMRKYEDLTHLSENREKQRAYYIPENEDGYTLLNGTGSSVIMTAITRKIWRKRTGM